MSDLSGFCNLSLPLSLLQFKFCIHFQRIMQQLVKGSTITLIDLELKSVTRKSSNFQKNNDKKDSCHHLIIQIWNEFKNCEAEKICYHANFFFPRLVGAINP